MLARPLVIRGFRGLVATRPAQRARAGQLLRASCLSLAPRWPHASAGFTSDGIRLRLRSSPRSILDKEPIKLLRGILSSQVFLADFAQEPTRRAQSHLMPAFQQPSIAVNGFQAKRKVPTVRRGQGPFKPHRGFEHFSRLTTQSDS